MGKSNKLSQAVWGCFSPIKSILMIDDKLGFLPFKIPVEKRSWNVPALIAFCRNYDVRMKNVIDLTVTPRNTHYTTKDFKDLAGITVHKMGIDSKELSACPFNCFMRFYALVQKIIAEEMASRQSSDIEDNEGSSDRCVVIGVHCVSGVARTGFFICSYALHTTDVTAARTIRLFENARGESLTECELSKILIGADKLPCIHWSLLSPLGKPIKLFHDGKSKSGGPMTIRLVSFKLPMKAKTVGSAWTVESLIDRCNAAGLRLDATIHVHSYEEPFYYSHVSFKKSLPDHILVRFAIERSNEVDDLLSHATLVRFRETVMSLRDKIRDQNSLVSSILIGVTCADGITASGFLLSSLIAMEKGIPPHQALAIFEKARGHPFSHSSLRGAISPHLPPVPFCQPISLNGASHESGVALVLKPRFEPPTLSGGDNVVFSVSWKLADVIAYAASLKLGIVMVIDIMVDGFQNDKNVRAFDLSSKEISSMGGSISSQTMYLPGPLKRTQLTNGVLQTFQNLITSLKPPGNVVPSAESRLRPCVVVHCGADHKGVLVRELLSTSMAKAFSISKSRTFADVSNAMGLESDHRSETVTASTGSTIARLRRVIVSPSSDEDDMTIDEEDLDNDIDVQRVARFCDHYDFRHTNSTRHNSSVHNRRGRSIGRNRSTSAISADWCVVQKGQFSRPSTTFGGKPLRNAHTERQSGSGRRYRAVIEDHRLEDVSDSDTNERVRTPISRRRTTEKERRCFATGDRNFNSNKTVTAKPLTTYFKDVRVARRPNEEEEMNDVESNLERTPTRRPLMQISVSEDTKSLRRRSKTSDLPTQNIKSPHVVPLPKSKICTVSSCRGDGNGGAGGGKPHLSLSPSSHHVLDLSQKDNSLGEGQLPPFDRGEAFEACARDTLPPPRKSSYCRPTPLYPGCVDSSTNSPPLSNHAKVTRSSSAARWKPIRIRMPLEKEDHVKCYKEESSLPLSVLGPKPSQSPSSPKLRRASAKQGASTKSSLATRVKSKVKRFMQNMSQITSSQSVSFPVTANEDEEQPSSMNSLSGIPDSVNPKGKAPVDARAQAVVAMKDRVMKRMVSPKFNQMGISSPRKFPDRTKGYVQLT